MNMNILERGRSLIAVTALLGLGLIGRSAPILAQERAAEPARASTSDIRDDARLFSPDAVDAARAEVRRFEERNHVQTLIETVESLGGASAKDQVKANAMRQGVKGIYVLIAKEEGKFELIVSPEYRETFTGPERREIVSAFLDRLKAKEFDQALQDGVKAIGASLARAETAGSLPRVDVGAGAVEDAPRLATGGALVVRDRVKLTLAGARRIIAGAEAKAAEMGQTSNIAVVDDGGHLLSFARMDGARPASAYTAITKATTAATFRQETGPLPKGATHPDPHLNLSLQNAAAASGGKITTLFGGVPIVVDGQVIGGVGVGGGTGEQDTQVAKAGIERFLSELNAPRGDDKARPAQPDDNRPRPTLPGPEQ